MRQIAVLYTPRDFRDTYVTLRLDGVKYIRHTSHSGFRLHFRDSPIPADFFVLFSLVASGGDKYVSAVEADVRRGQLTTKVPRNRRRSPRDHPQNDARPKTLPAEAPAAAPDGLASPRPVSRKASASARKMASGDNIETIEVAEPSLGANSASKTTLPDAAEEGERGPVRFSPPAVRQSSRVSGTDVM